MWAVIVLIFAILAAIIYPPVLLLAFVGAIGATIHYFATVKDPKDGAFALVLLLIGIAIVGGMYAWLGVAGAVIGVFAILLFVGMTSG